MSSVRQPNNAASYIRTVDRPNRNMSNSPQNTGRQIVEKLAASYARKSNEDHEGILGQHLVNEQRARKDDYMIPATPEFRYEDDDTTGISKRRSGFDKLLEFIRSGEAKFDRVYVKDKTRLGRWSDPRYAFFLEVLFEEHGVRIVYSENEQSLDYSGQITPDMVGLFLKDAVDGVVASQERERLIRRTTGGMRTWVLRGFYPGARVPYGLERWLADESTGTLLERIPDGVAVRRKGCRYKLSWSKDGSREVIREVFRRIEAGESLASIARRLEESGTPTPSGRGKWQSEMVRRIARNALYCGDLIWGRTTRDGDPVDAAEAEIDGEEAITIRDFLPDAPISRSQWEDIQRILDGNRDKWSQRRASAPEYLLSGLIACAGCGAGWHGHTSTRAARSRRRYYRHGELPKGALTCPAENRYVRSSEVEDKVMKAVAHVLRDNRLQRLTEEALRERLRNASSVDHEKQIADAGKRLQRYEQALQQLVRDRAFAATETERTICQDEIARIGGEIEHLKVQLRSLTEERDHLEALAKRRVSLVDRSRDLLELLAAGRAEDQKEAVAAVVHRVEIDPEVCRATIAVRAL